MSECEYKEDSMQSLMKQGLDKAQALKVWEDYDKQQTKEYNETIKGEVSNLRM
ncbi:hypothetical protein ACOMCU_01520 [Lysinibacillus sp. UGB7]|uniref:hypothetical protein n=1 Tax=Lysinibacillus sp. UGB7 TaxID=3411039 RepID=UPI003B82AB60